MVHVNVIVEAAGNASFSTGDPIETIGGWFVALITTKHVVMNGPQFPGPSRA